MKGNQISMEKITIKDVAIQAGVSVSTVSRVFNGYTDISDKTKDKVRQVAKELGYVANLAAHNLSSKKSKTIALIMNEITVTRGVAMHLETITAVVDYLDETNYEFLFYATNLKKQSRKTLRQLCNEHDISGVIIQGLNITDPYYKELETFNLPTVGIDLKSTNKHIGTVSINNQLAAFEITELLQKKGHQNILFVNGGKQAVVSHEREAGYRKASKNPKVIYAGYSDKLAYEMIKELYSAKEKPKYDAIFAASDLMAIGSLNALKEFDLAYDIAVVGFDDITLTSYFSPTITSVHQNLGDIAKTATQDLIAHIETGEVRHTIMPYKIVERESAKLF